MTTPQIYSEARALPAASALAHEHWEPQSREIPALLTARLELVNEEFEFIELRYQQALALVNMEYIFAEGLLGCS